MRIHSDDAWEVASQFSHVLASDTRTLAAHIDDLVNRKLDQAADVVVHRGQSNTGAVHPSSAADADAIRAIKHIHK